MQRFLQVDHDLAAIGKYQGDHAARALIVDIGIGFVIDSVATGLNGAEQRFRQVQKFSVSHYNFTMRQQPAILYRFSKALRDDGRSHKLIGALCLCLLTGCGQQGALYLPTEPAAAQRATLPETLLPSKRPAPANTDKP